MWPKHWRYSSLPWYTCSRAQERKKRRYGFSTFETFIMETSTEIITSFSPNANSHFEGAESDARLRGSLFTWFPALISHNSTRFFLFSSAHFAPALRLWKWFLHSVRASPFNTSLIRSALESLLTHYTPHWMNPFRRSDDEIAKSDSHCVSQKQHYAHEHFFFPFCYNFSIFIFVQLTFSLSVGQLQEDSYHLSGD